MFHLVYCSLQSRLTLQFVQTTPGPQYKLMQPTSAKDSHYLQLAWLHGKIVFPNKTQSIQSAKHEMRKVLKSSHFCLVLTLLSSSWLIARREEE